MKLSKIILAIILAIEFIAACTSFGYILDFTDRWGLGPSMEVFGIWVVLFVSLFSPVFYKLIEE